MGDFDTDFARARTRLGRPWSAQELAQGGALLERRRVRQTQVRQVMAASLLLVTGLALWGLRPEPSLQPVVQAEPDAPEAHRFADGSRAQSDAAARWRVEKEEAREVQVALDRGRVTFEVVHSERRTFRVRAGAVQVVDLGTVFAVNRSDEGVRVEVSEGRVRVEHPGGARELRAGESGLFFERAPVPVPAPEIPTVEPAPASKRREVARHAPWQAFAKRGEYAKAYSVMPRQVATSDSPGALLLAADVARLSGHPEEAPPYLERLLRHHRQDPRASLAAFTLGRVLLGELGEYARAASAFSTAYALDPAGPLAEDAAFRELEALHRAGDGVRARAQVERFLERYPHSGRREAARKLGGLR